MDAFNIPSVSGVSGRMQISTRTARRKSSNRAYPEKVVMPGNDFGEIFSFMLPETHIIATTAIKMFMRANGDIKDFTGISPDIPVKNTLEDIRQKRDRVIEKAVEWIAQ